MMENYTTFIPKNQPGVKTDCVVLSGYDLDNGTLQINDPLEGIVTRDYEEFKSIYDTVGKYAVVVKAASEEQK